MNRRTAARPGSRGLRTALWAIVGLTVLAAAPWVLVVGTLLAAAALLWWCRERTTRARRRGHAVPVERAVAL